MKVAVITDTHFGVRNDSSVFLDNADKFLTNIFFPKIKELGITQVLHLGDLFDRRKYINFVTLQRARQIFLDKLRDEEIDMTLALGNHCVYYKDSNSVNSPDLLLRDYDNITVYDVATEVVIGRASILLVPWINPENLEESITVIRNSRARVCMGHLELNGFSMNKTSVMDHGMDSELFEQFEVVASGHFHHPSQRGPIRYLGAMAQYDRGDTDDPRGFHIFDTETLEFEFVANPYDMFHKIEYDDTEYQGDILNIPDWVKDTYVDVVVNAKTNPELFSKFIQAIEDKGVVELKIEEKYITVEIDKTLELAAQSEDTKTIISDYIDHIETNVDRSALKHLMDDIHKEAISNR